MNQCLNCKTSLNNNSTYCSLCDQTTLNLHQSFTKITFQALHEMLDTDGRLANTLKMLLLSPGRLSKEYTEGRRVSYTPPLRMYLVISLIFFVIVPMTQTITNEHNNIQISFLLLPIGMLEQVPKLMFVMLPVYGLLIQLFHRKSFYVFNLVFALHVHSLIYLVLMLLLPVNHYANMHIVLFWLQYPLIGYFAFYLIIALKTMYGNSWLFTISVSFLTFILYIASIGLGLTFIDYYLA